MRTPPKDMRALFDRCRVLTKSGATVIVIHHTNRSGEARGSSDFGPASDQAFLVSNIDRDGGRLLDVITLKFDKSRYGHSGIITYQYAAGKMLRIAHRETKKPAFDEFQDLLRSHPGISTGDFERRAAELGSTRERARDFLTKGKGNGTIRTETTGRACHHFWVET